MFDLIPAEVVSATAASATTALGLWLRSRVRGATTAARVAREVTETRTAEWQAILRATNQLNARLEARLNEREQQLAARTSDLEQARAESAQARSEVGLMGTKLAAAEAHIERLESELADLRSQVEAMAHVAAEYRAAALGRRLTADLPTEPTDVSHAADAQTPVEGLLRG